MPSKKPINVEDQVAVDENGRRRFHGAFTGGFSAGFWNTVGSLEGWKPQEFKSSRQEKASLKRQRVEDFMDDEDLGEFGIAPQRVQTKDDFTDQKDLNKKQKVQKMSDGPIPGVPVLQSLLQPAKENVGVRLLKKMGWKEGQGIGARQTKSEKKKAKGRNEKELYIMQKYGCDLGNREEKQESEDEDELSDNEITFAPDDFDPFVVQLKENVFGLGYSGLDRNSVFQKRFSLFQPLEVIDKNNKKLSIAGQAFGVGAFEEEDDDIYARDDLTKYDFSLDDKKSKKTSKKGNEENFNIILGFRTPKDSQMIKHKTKVYKVHIPPNFSPRNWTEKRTRFDRIDENVERNLKETYKLKGLGRHDLKPDERGNLLNDAIPGSSKEPDTIQQKPTELSSRQKFLDTLNKKYEQFEKSSKDDNLIKPKEETSKPPESGSSSISKQFKPFHYDSGKQKRYEEFLKFKSEVDSEVVKFLTSIQPIELSEWDREMEKKEFIQARRLYQPLYGLMSDRFVSESEIIFESKKKEEKASNSNKKEIEMKRIKTMWKPKSLLCKRFNIPEPFGGTMVEEKKKQKPKFSVFDYLETSVNRKENFITPVVIPPKPKSDPKVDHRNIVEKEITSQTEQSKRLSVKEIFEKEIIKEPISNKKPIVKVVPKTELEQRSIDLKDKHPAEKKDLFKAIFESDSEDEEEKEKPPEKPDMSEILKKTATEINILKNNSPPRGIFANLFKKPEESTKEKPVPEPKEPEEATPKEEIKEGLASESKIIFRKKEDRIQDAIESGQMFGPLPPPQLPTASIEPGPRKSSEEDKLDKQLEKMLQNKGGLKIIEKWVEKDKIKKKKSKDKKSKKSKKEKEKKKAKKKDKEKR